jgi:hypothetical protein
LSPLEHLQLSLYNIRSSYPTSGSGTWFRSWIRSTTKTMGGDREGETYALKKLLMSPTVPSAMCSYLEPGADGPRAIKRPDCSRTRRRHMSLPSVRVCILHRRTVRRVGPGSRVGLMVVRGYQVFYQEGVIARRFHPRSTHVLNCRSASIRCLRRCSRLSRM